MPFRQVRPWLPRSMLAAGALLVLAAAPAARAVVVSYRAVDLADAPGAADRWRYTYQLDGFPYGTGWGFTVYFDPLLYGELEEPAQPGGGWDAIVAQPDPLLDSGFYDAEAISDLPRVSVTFSVVFAWLGGGAPGAQPYEVRDPSFAVAESGVTVVPEPGLAASGGAALAALAPLVARARARAPT